MYHERMKLILSFGIKVCKPRGKSVNHRNKRCKIMILKNIKSRLGKMTMFPKMLFYMVTRVTQISFYSKIFMMRMIQTKTS